VVAVTLPAVALCGLLLFVLLMPCIDRGCFADPFPGRLERFNEVYIPAHAAGEDWVRSPEQIARTLAGGEESGQCGDACSVWNLPADPNKAVIILTQDVRGDDSVAGIRYRIELGKQPDGTWAIEWLGEQYQCARGGTSGGWVAELCP
jgi:hypothetical protein